MSKSLKILKHMRVCRQRSLPGKWQGNHNTLRWWLVWLGVISGAVPAWALTEQELDNGDTQRLLEFMQTQGEQSTFDGAGGVTIHYQRFDQDCNGTAIIVLPGWSEPYLKYAEVIYDLRRKQYCVYAMDHRGQGLSARVVDNPQLGHVDDFSQYVRDLARFYQLVVAPQKPGKTVLLSHSMGGLIAAWYAAQQPQDIDGIVMIAPMLEVNTGAWPQWLAYSIVSVLDWLGFGESFVIGQGPWEEKPFAENRLTHSAVRYRFGVDLFRQNQALVVGGVSNRWLKTSMEYGDRVMRAAPEINTSILLFEAEQDGFVMHEPQRRFCRLAPRCERVYIPGSKHELLMETDTIRDAVFTRIYKFIGE